MTKRLKQQKEFHLLRKYKSAGAMLWLFLFVCASPVLWAQGTFSSGSTGADGDFAPTASTTVALPESGILNYKTVTIPSGVTVKFLRNSTNTPVTILAQGKVEINGMIDVSGSGGRFFGGQGGPGGFDGGRGAYAQGDDKNGGNGSGPGAGGGAKFVDTNTGAYGGGAGFATAGTKGVPYGGTTDSGGAGGSVYGFLTLIPLLGGSGGGGGSPYTTTGDGGGGGGGGGAILIASSTEIAGSGKVEAVGGNGSGVSYTVGGAGSGGAIRLVANAIRGTLQLNVSGGSSPARGGSGYIRLEGADTTNFNPTIQPNNAGYSISNPRPAIPANPPQLRIVSVNSVNVPNFIVGSFNGVDIFLPNTQTGPINVALAGTNIPLATKLQVVVVPQSGTPTRVDASALTGSQASSTATASVTLPAGQSLIYATGVIDLTLISSLAPMYYRGERVQKMELSAAIGGQSDITYITASGKRIKNLSE